MNRISSESSLFRCQPFTQTDRTGYVFIPNIPNIYFNQTSVASFYTGDQANVTSTHDAFTYIFTIPSESDGRNCNGTIVGLQYCYQQTGVIMTSPFDFLEFDRHGQQFTVTGQITISIMPTRNNCVNNQASNRYICCNIQRLPTGEFQLSSSTYYYGIRTSSEMSLPLSFNAYSSQLYRTEQYQFPSDSDSFPGTYSAEERNYVMDGPVFLMAIIIGIIIILNNIVTV